MSGVSDQRRFAWKQDRSALLVVTDTYDDPAFPALAAPRPDAERLAAALHDSAIGGFARPVLAVNEPVAALRHIIERYLRGLRADSLGLIHFAGHGVKDGGRFYFAATDTDSNYLESTAIPASSVHQILDDCNAGQLLVLVDCCNSGAFAPGLTPRAPVGAPAGQDELEAEGIMVLTASNAVEYAFEKGAGPVGGKPVTAVFTGAIIDALTSGTADARGDGLIAARDLYLDAVRRVEATRVRQTPMSWERVSGDILIARNPFHVRAAGIRASGAATRVSLTGDCLQIWREASFESGLERALAELGAELRSSGVAALLERLLAVLRESVIGRLAGGELLVAAALEVVNAFRRLDTDPGLARAAARVVRGVVSFGGRDYQAEAFAEWVRSLRTAVTTAVRFLREEEGLLPALSEAIGGGLALLEEVLNAAGPAELANLTAAMTVTLRRLARFLRGFAGDLDLEEALQELAAAIGNHNPGRALRGVLLRSTSYLYFAVSFAWEIPPDEAGGWIRQEAAKLWPKLRGEAADKAAERFIAALDGVGDEVQDFIGDADVAAAVRVLAEALGDGPELWSEILTDMNPFPEQQPQRPPPGFGTVGRAAVRPGPPSPMEVT